MATAQTIIRRSLRKLGVISLNRKPDAAQEAEGLEELDSTISDLLGCGGAYPMPPVRVESAYSVDPRAGGLRLLCVNGGISITFPKRPVDGARIGIVDVNGAAAASPITLVRNGMLIEGAAADLSLNSASVNRVYFFRADLGDWKRATGLSISSELPFPSEFDDSLVLIAARNFQSLFGGDLSPFDRERARAARLKIRNRYVTPLPMMPDNAISALGGCTSRGMTASDIEDFDG